MDYCSTRQKIDAFDTTVVVRWYRDKDGLGWKGRMIFYKERKQEKEAQPLCKNHSITVRQTLPLGGIHVSLDECGHGSWQWNSFEGTGLTERDLEWATAWAVWGVLDKHRRSYLEINDFRECGSRLNSQIEELDTKKHD
jgi:hypothetical protein